MNNFIREQIREHLLPMSDICRTCAILRRKAGSCFFFHIAKVRRIFTEKSVKARFHRIFKKIGLALESTRAGPAGQMIFSSSAQLERQSNIGFRTSRYTKKFLVRNFLNKKTFEKKIVKILAD